MKRFIIALGAMTLALSCTMKNPLLSESTLPFGAPEFDKIKAEHYLPAFEAGIAEAKAEIDAIVNNPDQATFENTIEALEFAGQTLNRVSGIFYNVNEADTNDELQAIAEQISPMMTEYSMYISLNEKLFERIDKVYNQRAELGLAADQMKLLEDTWKSFARNGAKLNAEDKATYSKLSEELSLLTLKFSKNALSATNAYKMNLTDESDLEGLPDFVKEMAAATAKELGHQGWTFDLSAPSYGAFMKYSTKAELRKQFYLAYNTRAFGGEFDNSEVCRQIANTRLKIANILGYKTYADYALENRMAKTTANVEKLLNELMGPSLPAAKHEVSEIYQYAKAHGYKETALQAWDFSYWSEQYKNATYSLSDEELKPYFQLENCIDAVFGLATKLYGLKFIARPDLPAYHKDVKVYEVQEADGKHLALYYADFFPRASKRSGAWMNNIREQSIINGVENRPFVVNVTNFSKPTETTPSLLTHDELTTFLHEFGHALHGMMAQGRYTSLTGTNVVRDFVELPSQIMENWGTEAEYLKPFAKHYQTGEEIPTELIDKIVESKNYLAAYSQVRQLQFGLIDMQWYTTQTPIEANPIDIEKKAIDNYRPVPEVANTCTSTSFSHIFSGGYSAGYYSYKWAEVLEADAWSLFAEKGIFNKEVASSFRNNILSKGSVEDEDVLYRNFRGHDPEPAALLKKLGISTNK